MEHKLYIYKKQKRSVMNLQADIKWIHQELDKVTDVTLVTAIKNILEYRRSVASKHITIKQYNKELNEADARIDKGEFYTQEEIEKIASQW